MSHSSSNSCNYRNGEALKTLAEHAEYFSEIQVCYNHKCTLLQMCIAWPSVLSGIKEGNDRVKGWVEEEAVANWSKSNFLLILVTFDSN